MPVALWLCIIISSVGVKSFNYLTLHGVNDWSICEFWKLEERIDISYWNIVIRNWISGTGKFFELSYFCVGMAVEKLEAEDKESYESSAVEGERLVFLFGVTHHLVPAWLACNCDTLSPCIFSGLEREMEYSENIVNSLQEYLGNLTDIYL